MEYILEGKEEKSEADITLEWYRKKDKKTQDEIDEFLPLYRYFVDRFKTKTA